MLVLRDVPNLVNAAAWDERTDGIYVNWPADVESKCVTVKVRVYGVDSGRIEALLARHRRSIERQAQLQYDALPKRS
jgi:hypothetical protein